MRTLGLLALVALFPLIPVGAASAKGKPKKVEAFAAKHRLSGAWKGKDADKDGLTNHKEFKLGTDPRKADSDRDGLKDGDEVLSGNHPLKADTDRDGIKDGQEHAGTITAFDGTTLTLREFATGRTVTATLDTECTPAPVEDPEADDDEDIDFFQEEDEDEEPCTDDDVLRRGLVLQSAEFEDGFLVDYYVAG